MGGSSRIFNRDKPTRPQRSVYHSHHLFRLCLRLSKRVFSPSNCTSRANDQRPSCRRHLTVTHWLPSDTSGFFFFFPGKQLKIQNNLTRVCVCLRAIISFMVFINRMRVCCSELQRVEASGKELQWVVVRCKLIAVNYNVCSRMRVCCSVVQRVAVSCSE